jgi:hypothetical protein
MSPRFVPPYLCALFALTACSFEQGGGDGGDSTTGASGIDSLSSSPSGGEAPTGADDDGATGPSGSGESGNDSAPSTTGADTGADAADTAAETGDGTGNDPGNPVDCGGTVYTCGDGMDNDGDGHIDLGDPECTGPCDDDESTYQTGIPGDNMDCKQDCFFDGNSGQGDDGCIWHLTCDPANPGEFIGCEFNDGPNCDGGSPNQSEDCIMFCEQYVPPGCDCFGCCTVCGDEGCVDIFLNGSPDCALDNLEACTMCTSQIEECGNPCEPEMCEICFGETEPPEGCGENECMDDLPCEASPDCPVDYFCYLGCCYPPPPG